MKKTYALVFPLVMATMGVYATVLITPSTGYTITWDGNDGDHFDGTPPPGGSLVPSNLALSGTAFASSVIGGGGFPIHQIAHLNDGFYGNSNSWIGDTLNAHAGVYLDGLYEIASFAFGRDNGNDIEDGFTAQYMDRSLGIYTIEMTSDGGTNWFTIGTLEYQSDGDGVPGGTFDSYFRHEYGVSLTGGAPILANGIRIQTAPSGTDAIAIDQIEVYAVPEASTLWLMLLSLGCVGLWRRRSGRRW